MRDSISLSAASLLHDLASIASVFEGSVIFQVSLNRAGDPVDIECLASANQWDEMIPLDLLLERPVSLKARSVIYLSRAHESLARPNPTEIELTSHLIQAASAAGIKVLDHYLAAENQMRSLSSTTAIWTDS